MPRGRMGGRHGMSTEKAKDFKGTRSSPCSDICNRKYYI